MNTDRLLHLRAPAPGSSPAGPRVPSNPQRLRLPHASSRMRRASVACSSSGSGGDRGMTYKCAGVDIDAGTELVRRIVKMVPGIGGFGGPFPWGDDYPVAGTDGVGTKLKLAFETGIHDTIGIDLVAMSVNDIVTSGYQGDC